MKTLYSILIGLTIFSCASAPKYTLITKADYLNPNKWIEVEGTKIYSEIHTSVMGLLAKMTIVDEVNLDVKNTLEAIDRDKNKYITPRELNEFKKFMGF